MARNKDDVFGEEYYEKQDRLMKELYFELVLHLLLKDNYREDLTKDFYFPGASADVLKINVIETVNDVKNLMNQKFSMFKNILENYNG